MALVFWIVPETVRSSILHKKRVVVLIFIVWGTDPYHFLGAKFTYVKILLFLLFFDISLSLRWSWFISDTFFFNNFILQQYYIYLQTTIFISLFLYLQFACLPLSLVLILVFSSTCSISLYLLCFFTCHNSSIILLTLNFLLCLLCGFSYFHFLTQTCLELMAIFIPHSPKYWD